MHSLPRTICSHAAGAERVPAARFCRRPFHEISTDSSFDHPVPGVRPPVSSPSRSSTGFRNACRIRIRHAAGSFAGNAARPLVIFFHGNGGNRGGRVGWYDVLADVDCDVLAIDYQGYGDSEGKPSQTALENDARAAWAFAVDHLGRDPESIVVMGVSLGGAVAVALAAEQCRNGPVPAGLVTVATFSSMVEVAASKYRWVPVRAVLLDRYPSADRISQVTVPFLHFHGEDDRIVEPEFGRRLFEQAPERSVANIPRRWVTLPQTGHNDILLRSRRIVLEELRRFVRSVAAAPAER